MTTVNVTGGNKHTHTQKQSLRVRLASTAARPDSLCECVTGSEMSLKSIPDPAALMERKRQ